MRVGKTGSPVRAGGVSWCLTLAALVPFSRSWVESRRAANADADCRPVSPPRSSNRTPDLPHPALPLVSNNTQGGSNEDQH